MYALAACAFTWPLVLHPRSLFGAVDPAGDPSLNLWALGWGLRTLSAHPTWLLTGRVFDAPIFLPARHTLAYADHFLLQAVLLWPLYAVTHDLVFCYNVLLIASLIATALAMHALARALVSSERAAYVAGLIFGFAPFHFTHLTHIQLQALYFLPLSLLFLHRVFEGQRRRDAIALGAVVGLETLSSIYYGVIGVIGLVTAAAVLTISKVLPSALSPQPSALQGEPPALSPLPSALTPSLLPLAAAIAILVALPWSLPYLRVERDAAGGRNLFEAGHGSAVLASYVQAPEMNLVYGRTGWLVPSPGSRLPRKAGPEQALFPGFCALLLAVIGAVAPPSGLRRTAAVYTALAVVGIVLSLGPDGFRLLYAALYRLLFGMAAIRAAARFSVLTLCGIAVLAAIAVRAIELRLSRSGASRLASSVAGAIVFAVIAVEYSNGSIAFPSAPALTSDAGRWLRDRSEPGAVVCLPLTFDTGNTPCMLQSLEHGRRIVNGYSSVRPPFFAALVDAVRRVPSPDSLLALHELGVTFIVSDRPLPLDPARDGAVVERARFSGQRVYELVWSPAAESADSAEADAPPPEPGRPPFAVGESATYQIHWTSGPMNLSAGEAVVAVRPPRGSEAFRFVVSAATAPWVSRFFEADANLETTASGRLLPLRNRQTLIDGKRRVERELEFDARDRLVRMTTGGTAVTLPLALDARDPISALFYVRTLPFQAGAHVRLPLSDNGRPSRLDVTVVGQETIVLDGRPRSAWKLEPRLSERVERQDPLSMVAWVSDDARRVPLRVEVSAGFGSVRLDLAGYRDHEETH